MKEALPFIIGAVVLIVLIALAGGNLPGTQSAYSPGTGFDFTYDFKPIRTSNDQVFLNDPVFIGKDKFESTPLSFNCKSVGLRTPPQGTNFYSNCRCTHTSQGTGRCTEEAYEITDEAIDASCWTTNISYDALAVKQLKTSDVWEINPYITVSYTAEGSYEGDAGCYLTVFSGVDGIPGNKPKAGFLDDGTAWKNKFGFNIDVVNGIETYINSGQGIVELGNTTNITVTVENRIADGLQGGIFVIVKQKGFFTGEVTFRVDKNLSLENNTFQISVPNDELGTTEVSMVGFVKVDVPSIGPDGKTTLVPWYGTDDVKTNAAFEVVKYEQLSQFASKTLVPYNSPYKKPTTTPVSVSASGFPLWLIWIGGLLCAVIIFAIIIKRR